MNAMHSDTCEALEPLPSARKLLKHQLADFYLEYLNDYLTSGRYAEHCGMAVEDCKTLLALGRKYHEERVAA